MKYEVSERIRTDKLDDDVLRLAWEQFHKISRSVSMRDDQIVAKGVEASFGSANRSDKTIISLRHAEDGWLMVADVDYHPSLFFWLFLIVLLFTWIGWIIPIIFYLVQKNAVKQAIEGCLNRISTELNRADGRYSAPVVERISSLDELDKLASLRDRGIITEEEFSIKKTQLLRAK